MSINVGIQSMPIPPIELAVSQALAAEADGFDSIWYADHLMGWFPKSLWTPEASSITTLLPSPHIYLDPAVLIGIVGQATSTVQLGTAVTEPIRRTPAELARTFLTLSHATGGRAILGIGAGERENIEPYGLDFRYQVSKLEEALKIVRMLWESKDPVDFEGRFWTLRSAVLDLEPFDGRFPEIWVGAHGPRMLEITGRYGDGWIPSYPMSPEEYAAKLQTIRSAAETAGRDPDAITAGYQMYAIVAPDHETAHEIMNVPLAGAMALVASAELWERVGLEHPLGKGFDGLRDYVPEWYSREELERAVAQYRPEMFHDILVHGTVEEVVDQISSYIDAGLQHPVFVNLSILAGLEYLAESRKALAEAAATLKR